MKNYFTPCRIYTRSILTILPRLLRRFVFMCTHSISSDKSYIKIVYFLTFGKWLDLDHPETLVTFNEKLQWLKMHNNTPLHTKMVDKFAVREIIDEKMGPGHVFPLLGVWEHFDDIDFSKLPDKFVLKPTHDSGSIVFCRDKKNFDIVGAKKKLEAALKRNYYWLGRERPYRDIPPRLIAEPLMVDESGTQLKDYKLFCFDGVVKMIQVDFDRFTDHHRNLYTPEWKLIDAFMLYPHAPDKTIPPPVILPQMLSAASQLSQGFPFVRVDFYVINGKLYFGEFTFHHEGGYGRIKPDSFNVEMGSWIKLPCGSCQNDRK